MARKIDLAKVQQAKAMFAIGKPYVRIAKELGISTPTAQRYVTMELDEEYESVVKKKHQENLEKFVDRAWKSINESLSQIEEALKEKEFKPRELIVVAGTLFDKVASVRQMGQIMPTNQQINFNFFTNDDSRRRADQNTTSIPYESGEIQSDDSRSGSGENVLALPGSCEAVAGVSGSDGGDYSINIQESL